MFGLTRREQRWKAEQEAAETLLSFVGTVVTAAAASSAAEKAAQVNIDELKRLREENAALLQDLRMSANVINIQLQTIKELEQQLAEKGTT